MQAETVHRGRRPVLIVAVAATLFVGSFLWAGPSPVSAHYGCGHTDYLILHSVTGPDHYDYLDWWSHWNAQNHHWNQWNNATHDYFHTDDCGCIAYPCPVTVVPWIQSQTKRTRTSRVPRARRRRSPPRRRLGLVSRSS